MSDNVIQFPIRGCDRTLAWRRCGMAEAHAKALGAVLSERTLARIGDLLDRGAPPERAVEIACCYGASWFEPKLEIAS